MDPIEQENALLEQRIAQLEATLSASQPAPVGGSITNALATGTGGLINLGDILTFGQLSKGIAAVPAIGRDIYGLATGAAPQDYYAEELSKVNALKNLYAQQREAQGLSGLETALSFMAPTPGGKAEAFTSLARPLKEAGLGLAAYGGSELGEAITGGPGGAIAGALAAPLSLSLGKAGAKALAPSVEEAGKGLQRTSLGIRQSDYTKAAKNQIIESLPGDFETTLKNSADRLLENKTLGSSTNPDVLYSNLRDAKESTETAIQGVLQEVDKTRKTGIIPRLDKTLEWIQTKAPATEVKYYKEKVNEFLKALKEQGQGSLVYLNQQKKAIGENWKQSPETDPTFWRRFYTDVKDTIEEYAPEVKQLNKDKRDLLVVEPVIERAKRAAEKPMTPQDLTRALLYTTGGAGLPGAAYLTGSPILGTALAGGLAIAGTKPGQSLLGRALTATGRAAQELETTPLLEQASRFGYFGARGAQQAATETPVSSTGTPAPAMDDAAYEAENTMLEQRIMELEKKYNAPVEAKVGKQNISIPTGEKYAPASLVKAVMKIESGGKQEAVSSKGARGLMQLMPATARDLGVDAKDPKQNVEGGSRYLQQQLSEFGDESLALAAYNWGPNNIKRAMAKVRAEGKRPTWANIKAYVKVPKETREYVDKVLSLINVPNKQETLTEKTSPSLLRTAASFAPVTGEIISAQDAINALQEGEYSNAAINALGVIPAFGLFNRIRKGAKLVDAISDAAKAAPLTEADILYNRANKALRDIDINSLINSLKSKQTLQNTYAELVEKARARLARGVNKGKAKSWMDEQVAYLNENKAKLDAITAEINNTQQLLQNAIGLKQVK